jgi:hypothetical protein
MPSSPAPSDSQALYALLQPSYPPDLLPFAFKPWQLPQQDEQQQAAGRGRDPPAHPSAGPGQLGAQQQQQRTGPGPCAQALWQMMAAGNAADRLLPVLAKCVPLLADVVDKVMTPVAGLAEAATAAAGTAVRKGTGPISLALLDACRQAAAQPAAGEKLGMDGEEGTPGFAFGGHGGSSLRPPHVELRCSAPQARDYSGCLHAPCSFFRRTHSR